MRNKKKLNFIPLIFFSLTIFFCLLDFIANAQVQPANFNIGFETGGTAVIPAKNQQANIPTFWSVRTAPFINFRLGKNTFVGLNYEDQRGKLDGESLPTLFGLGVHVRQYFDFINNRNIKDRLQLFGEVAYLRLNYLLDDEAEFGTQKLSNFSNQNFQIIAGANVRLLHSFYLNYGLRPMFYSEGERFKFSNRLGFEFHFGEKRAPLPQPKVKPPKDNVEQARPFDLSYFLKRTTLGTSFTYIVDRDDFLPSYKEKTWNFNIATSLTSDLYFGLSYLFIRVQEANSVNRNHHLAGGFLQYDFIRKLKSHRVFLELGLYEGDLCSCGDKNPYYEPRLRYLSYGTGADIKISKQIPLFLDLSFLWYRVMNNNIEDRWAISQYVVGLNYRFYGN